MGYGVTTAAKRAAGTAQAIERARLERGKAARAPDAAQQQWSTLRGEMEHASHEAAVGRYMTARAKDKQLYADRVVGASIIAGVVVLAVLFVLANLTN